MNYIEVKEIRRIDVVFNTKKELDDLEGSGFICKTLDNFDGISGFMRITYFKFNNFVCFAYIEQSELSDEAKSKIIEEDKLEYQKFSDIAEIFFNDEKYNKLTNMDQREMYIKNYFLEHPENKCYDNSVTYIINIIMGKKSGAL